MVAIICKMDEDIVCFKNQSFYQLYTLQKANNKGADQTAWNLRLVSAFVKPKAVFTRWSYVKLHFLVLLTCFFCLE